MSPIYLTHNFCSLIFTDPVIPLHASAAISENAHVGKNLPLENRLHALVQVRITLLFGRECHFDEAHV